MTARSLALESQVISWFLVKEEGTFSNCGDLPHDLQKTTPPMEAAVVFVFGFKSSHRRPFS
jgi:hypothetical protein